MSVPTTAPSIRARGHRVGEREEQTPERRRSRTILVAALVLVVLAGLVGLLARPEASQDPLSPHNADPEGARAAAQVLQQQGVSVTFVTTTAAALSEAEAGSTLLIVDPGSLRTVQQEALAAVEADVVLAGIDGDLGGLTDRIEISGYEGRATRSVDCDDPDAQAAESILAGGALLDGDVDTACFSTTEGSLYVTWTDGDQTWRAISDAGLLTNAALPVAGNAALVFRSLGAHERLVWYLPDPDDTFGEESSTPLLPIPSAAVLQLALVGLAVVLWRGRRLGPVVVEPLPVVVKASETTRGRGRLYRRANAHAHAASALRAGLVARVAGRVGLPSHAQPHDVVETLARASGRSPEAITDVLYGPAPTTDEGLMALTQALDTLESEVQRG